MTERYKRKFKETVDFDKIAKEIKDMTRNNAHGDAVEYLAKSMGYKKYEKILNLVNQIHKLEGSMRPALIQYRNSILDEILSEIKKHDHEGYKKIHDAF
jgi:hypothetical protein